MSDHDESETEEEMRRRHNKETRVRRVDPGLVGF